MTRTMVTTVLLAAFASSANAALIDSFTRTDVAPVTDSLGATEFDGYDYIERGNNASGSTVDGTAEISNNKLLITGALQATSAAYLNTGGVYLSGFNAADVRVAADLNFVLVGPAPSGTTNANDNRFNNTFLLMLRSRAGQNFGTGTADQAGLLAIELNANGDLQVREQRPTTGLANILNINPATGSPAARQPLPGTLPANFGSGTFDINQNGYLDANEPIHFEAELVGTSLKVFVNGAQYGGTGVLGLTSVVAGQLNGIGLHKNRLGSTFTVGSNILVDNLDVTVIPEPVSLVLLAVFGCVAPLLRVRRR